MQTKPREIWLSGPDDLVLKGIFREIRLYEDAVGSVIVPAQTTMNAGQAPFIFVGT